MANLPSFQNGSPELTPYELMVQRNIEDNQNVLRSLGLLNTPSTKKVKVNPTKRRRLSLKPSLEQFPKAGKEADFDLTPRSRVTRRSSTLINTNNFAELADDEENTPPQKKNKVVHEPCFGEIEGVQVGDWWYTRMECSAAGVHRPTVAGISGRFGEGCYSIALSGGYADDLDYGESFTYTGSGGRDLKGTKANPKNLRTAPQSKDQTFDGMNAALALNVENKRPVRVIRGYKLPSIYAPEEGYRYDGLYSVEKCWTAVGLSGFNVCKFVLKRLPNQDPPPWKVEQESYASETTAYYENNLTDSLPVNDSRTLRRNQSSNSEEIRRSRSPKEKEKTEADCNTSRFTKKVDQLSKNKMKSPDINQLSSSQAVKTCRLPEDREDPEHNLRTKNEKAIASESLGLTVSGEQCNFKSEIFTDENYFKGFSEDVQIGNHSPPLNNLKRKFYESYGNWTNQLAKTNLIPITNKLKPKKVSFSPQVDCSDSEGVGSVMYLVSEDSSDKSEETPKKRFLREKCSSKPLTLSSPIKGMTFLNADNKTQTSIFNYFSPVMKKNDHEKITTMGLKYQRECIDSLPSSHVVNDEFLPKPSITSTHTTNVFINDKGVQTESHAKQTSHKRKHFLPNRTNTQNHVAVNASPSLMEGWIKKRHDKLKRYKKAKSRKLRRNPKKVTPLPEKDSSSFSKSPSPVKECSVVLVRLDHFCGWDEFDKACDGFTECNVTNGLEKLKTFKEAFSSLEV